MADFCLSCCKERHAGLKTVSDKRFIISKYTSMCSGCGLERPITLGIKPKKKIIFSVGNVVRHLN